MRMKVARRGGCAQSTFLSRSRMRLNVIKGCSSDIKLLHQELKTDKDLPFPNCVSLSVNNEEDS